MTNAKYAKLAAGLVVAWFIFSISASALHLFENNSARLGLGVGLAAGIPVVLFSVWFAASAGFRRFAMNLNPRVLTLVHTWRIGGFTFLVLNAFGILPAIFAWPAGLGDMLIGVTAPLVAWRLAQPDHRNRFVLWQALGVLDLVTAVSLGTTAGLISPHAVAMTAMTELPLSVIPTFVVPLLLIFHIICIAQARRWPKREQVRYSEQLRPSAA
jgi:hypothetical protein